MRRVLTVGGSEAAGRAGVAVDLRAFAAHGVHGCMALSAVTAQPAGGVLGVGPKLLRAQIESATPLAAAKVGLLLSAAQAQAVLDSLSPAAVPIVFDPVQRSSTGVDLVAPAEWRQLVERMLPRVQLFTPNLDEAGMFLGRAVEDSDAAVEAAGREILARGVAAVLMKGGHRKGAAVDLLLSEQGLRRFEGERLPFAFRGTGCLLSSSIVCLLARGRALESAVEQAKEFLDGAMRAAAEGDSDLPHAFFEFYGIEGLPSRA